MQKAAEVIRAKDVAKASELCTSTRRKELCEALLRALPEEPAKLKKLQKEIIQYFEAGCAISSDMLCIMLAYMIVEAPKSVPGRSAKEAIEIFQRTCDKGIGGGCTRLGKAKVNGTGTKRSLQEAGQLFQKGCELRDALGCANLAALHARGAGVAKDTEKAKELRKKACELGDRNSCR